MHSEKLLEVYQRLLRSAQKGSVLAILQCAHAIFAAPIVLTNERYRLISLWPQEPINDAVFDSLLHSPLLPIELVQDYTSEYLQGKDAGFSPFYVTHGPVGAHPRIFAEVVDQSTNKRRTLGHFGIILGDKPLEDWHLEASAILADLLSILLSRQLGFVPHETNAASRILFDLLDPALSREKFEKNSRAFLNDFPLPWQMLYADVGTSTDLKILSPVVVADIAERFPNLAILHDSNELILLSASKKNSQADQIQLLKAAKILQEFAYQSVLLPKIIVVEKILSMRELAKTTVTYLKQIGESKAQLFIYDDLAESLFSYILAQHPASQGICHPLLDQLQVYDEINESDYYLTLETYCVSNYRMAKTAEKLHIHRNTLIYRLNRIQESFDVDLSDEKLLPVLSISFQVKKLINSGIK